jgi:SAM-dependent methyltransferase
MESRDQLMDNIMAFWKSRAILTACNLDVFTRIDQSPGTAKQIATAQGADPFAMERLLNSLAAMGLLYKKEDTFHLSPQGALLSSLQPDSVLAMALHFNDVWEKWGALTNVVKEGRHEKQQTSTRDKKTLESFIGAMDAIARDLSVEIARSFDASHFRRLLDIGGGSGTYTVAFLNENPSLTAVLFDLEPVITIAENRLRADAMVDRVQLVPGDFYRDELPAGCDFALLSAIIHQNSPLQNLDLFRKIFRALDPGGTLLIRDHIMDETRTEPQMGTLFALNMLVVTPGGDTYSFTELKESLNQAGFVNVRLIRQGDRMDGLIEAQKTGL